MKNAREQIPTRFSIFRSCLLLRKWHLCFPCWADSDLYSDGCAHRTNDPVLAWDTGSYTRYGQLDGKGVKDIDKLFGDGLVELYGAADRDIDYLVIVYAYHDIALTLVEGGD